MTRSDTVAALAGRRIDAHGASPSRFPSHAVPAVAARLERVFLDRGVDTIVASAACGADIVALEVATRLGISRCVIIPYDRVTFCQRSVTDHGRAEWKERYDVVIDAADMVIELGGAGPDAERAGGYRAATMAIIAEARARAGAARPLAVAVWDSDPRETSDETATFVAEAQRRGFEYVNVPILGQVDPA